MRYSLFLLPLAAFGLAGCVGVGSPSPQRASFTDVTPTRTARYMTPEQSSTLIILPGDATTPVQLRYLSNHQENADNLILGEDIQRRAGL
jgi:hypothetical protein